MLQRISSTEWPRSSVPKFTCLVTKLYLSFFALLLTADNRRRRRKINVLHHKRLCLRYLSRRRILLCRIALRCVLWVISLAKWNSADRAIVRLVFSFPYRELLASSHKHVPSLWDYRPVLYIQFYPPFLPWNSQCDMKQNHVLPS